MGGGSSAGAVDYPDYMKAAHEDWLTQSGTDSISSSITEVMNTALAANPWAAQLAYDPDVDLAASTAAIAAFAAVLAGVVDTTSWAALMTQAKTSVGAKYDPTIVEATIVADVAAFASDLDDNVTANILPRYRRGMNDINAVSSSAFVIGEAIIEAMQAKDVARYDAELRTKIMVVNAEMDLKSDLAYQEMYLNASQQMLQILIQRINWNSDVAKMTIESNRIKIVAKKEEMDENIDIDIKDALWDLEVFKHGGNLLASISGGTSGSSGPSKLQSAIGGAMSGAASGAMIGSAVPGLGTVAGGVIGGAVGLLGGLF